MTDLLSVHVMFKYMNACDRYFLETGAFMKSWIEWKWIKCTNLNLTFVYAQTFSSSRFSLGMNISFVVATQQKNPKSTRTI